MSDTMYTEELYDDLLCTLKGLSVLCGNPFILNVYRERGAYDTPRAYFEKWGFEEFTLPEIESFEELVNDVYPERGEQFLIFSLKSRD
jgi:hypothetical protein